MTKHEPGVVRDAIMNYLRQTNRAATVGEIHAAVNEALGETIPPSSIRSYMAENAPRLFERMERGRYRLVKR